MRAHYARARKRLDALAGGGGEGAPLHPQTVAAAIDRLASDDAVFMPDVGSPVVRAALSDDERPAAVGGIVQPWDGG